MSRAIRTLDDAIELSGTVDLHIQYMEPATGCLTARAWVEHRTKGTAFCRGEIRSEHGLILATGSGTIRIRR